MAGRGEEKAASLARPEGPARKCDQLVDLSPAGGLGQIWLRTGGQDGRPVGSLDRGGRDPRREGGLLVKLGTAAPVIGPGRGREGATSWSLRRAVDRPVPALDRSSS